MSTFALSKTEIDKIDKPFKLTVFGFIRESQKLFPTSSSSNNFHIIPDIISYLILLYYHQTEGFNKDLCGKNITISNNDKIIDNKNSNGWSTVYGKRIIPSTLNDIMYTWKFKNIGDATEWLNIGIDNANATLINKCGYKHNEKACYWYYGFGTVYSWDNGAKSPSKIERFQDKNDILTMKLKFDKNAGILSYAVNEKEFVAYSNITRDSLLDYRMAISLNKYHKNVSVELIEFNVEKLT